MRHRNSDDSRLLFAYISEARGAGAMLAQAQQRKRIYTPQNSGERLTVEFRARQLKIKTDRFTPTNHWISDELIVKLPLTIGRVLM